MAGMAVYRARRKYHEISASHLLFLRRSHHARRAQSSSLAKSISRLVIVVEVTLATTYLVLFGIFRTRNLIVVLKYRHHAREAEILIGEIGLAKQRSPAVASFKFGSYSCAHQEKVSKPRRGAWQSLHESSAGTGFCNGERLCERCGKPSLHEVGGDRRRGSTNYILRADGEWR